jgi:hypothetical protein
MSNWTHVGTLNGEHLFVDFTRPLRGEIAECERLAAIPNDGITGRLPKSIDEARMVGECSAHYTGPVKRTETIRYIWCTQYNRHFTNAKFVWDLVRRQELINDDRRTQCTTYPVVTL